MKENEKDNFNAIQHFDLWSSHLTLGKIHASTVLRLLNRCLGAVRLSDGTRDCNATLRPPVREYADVTVSNATLTSNMSEGVCIEGKNSITLNNCQMTVSNTQRNGHAQFLDAIMIYQSFSGDADSGN